jgi:hypothetical protein
VTLNATVPVLAAYSVHGGNCLPILREMR